MAYWIRVNGYKYLGLVNKAHPWWKEEDSSCPRSYVLYLIEFVVDFISLRFSHTDENMFFVQLESTAKLWASYHLIIA